MPEAGREGQSSDRADDERTEAADADEATAAVAEATHHRILRIELDVTTMVVVGTAVFGALALAALFEGAPATITRIAIALLFTLALDPLVVAASRRFHLPRRGAVALVGTAFGVGLLAVVLVVGPAAVRQARQFGEELPQTLEGLYDIPLLGSRLQEANAAERINEWIDGLPGELDADVLSQLADTFVGGVGAALTVIVFVVALLLDGEVLVARMRNLLPPSRRDGADRMGRLFYGTVGSYFAGSIFVAVLDGLYVLTLGLILGVPLAPVAGLWSMITNLIPQIGGFLGGSFFVLLAFSASPLTGLLALVGFVAYMNFENNVIQPAIVGQSMNLSPPTTMVAALVGGAVAGVPGAIAVTPLVGTAKALYWGLRGRPVEPPKPRIPIIDKVKSWWHRLRPT
jgi:predicted PurR-regulated permease PerM